MKKMAAAAKAGAQMDGATASDRVGDMMADQEGIGFAYIFWKTCEQQCTTCNSRREKLGF